MELIAIRRAAVLFYFQLERINPLRKAIDLDVTKLFVERYGFLKYPSTYEDYNSDTGVFLGMGKWGDLAIQELRFFPNGVLVSTGDSTDRAEQFFADAMTVWQDVGLSFSVDWVVQRTYISQLAVKSDVDLVSVNQAIEGLVAATFSNAPTGFAAVNFFTGGSIDALPPIRLERLVGQPLGSGQFWAQAPLPTTKHIEFLEAFEKTLR